MSVYSNSCSAAGATASSRRAWPLQGMFAAFAVGVALLLGACGDDSGSAGVPATASPLTTSAATATAEATTAATPAPIEATDSGGVAITLEGPAQRIVSHSPGVTEILFAIGAGGQVVAVDEFSDFPSAAAALPKVTYTAPDPEQDLSFEPDLVILASNQEQSVGQFRSLGVPVFYLREPDDLDGVMESIRLLGRLSGHEAEAEALASDMEQRLAAVTSVVADVEAGPRVFWELDSTLYTVSPETFIGAALAVLKAQNIATGATSPYPQLTAEAVVAADPEVILLADAQWGVTVESVGERPGWASITAVVEGRVHPVDEDIMSRPGPRIVDGLEAIAALLYPDLFQ
ncbi:MAG: helical backbone metal receptor [Dehalococcoidia bacterium]